MTKCDCGSKNIALRIRAREQSALWGQKQVYECRDCGNRWSE